MDKDRTDVLAGGRLDSRGAQTGTKHSYATSEVRATRLLERVCELVNAFRYNAQGAYWVRDKGLVAAFVVPLRSTPDLASSPPSEEYTVFS